MPETSELDYRPSYLAAACTALAVFVIYCLTLAPSTAMWDTSEYISAAYVLGLPHPPGNPLFVLLGRTFAVLPLGGLGVAVRINILAALTSAISAAMWFLVAERVLVTWLPERWQRITGGAAAALIGATAFTVWNQSVVNEKVYTVSALGLAIISWLTVRWSDDPEGEKADRLLVLISYLLALGWANHQMGLLAAPAVLVAVLMRRPETFLRWRLLLACAAVFALGMTPYATQPIRSAHFPPINEGEPVTWQAFWDNFTRAQYAKPPLTDRQAPFLGQLGMWWYYFKWQWLRDSNNAHGALQGGLAALFGLLGIAGGYVHWKRDRRSFWYFGTFLFTVTIALIIYLNFKYGNTQSPELGDAVPREVRDRDYFFLVSFAAWGVWAGLGLVWVWEGIAELFGTVRVKIGRETVDTPVRLGWIASSLVLAVAFIPLATNWRSASRAHQTDTRDFAHDLLDSVEPYGVLITAGDNDTFPLWYAQEVEGIRKDVLVLCTSLLNTDWYIRQAIRRPVYDYDAAKGPALYRGRAWPKPVGSPIHLSMQQAAMLPEYYQVTSPQEFRKDGIVATIQPQYLERASVVVLDIIRDDWPARPIFFSRTTGSYAQQLGLDRYMLTQGLARKLLPVVPTASRDTVFTGDGWLDVHATVRLWDETFLGPQAVIRRGLWVDRASVGIPYMYIASAMNLSQVLAAQGDTTEALRFAVKARELAKATALEQMFAPMAPGGAPR